MKFIAALLALFCLFAAVQSQTVFTYTVYIGATGCSTGAQPSVTGASGECVLALANYYLQANLVDNGNATAGLFNTSSCATAGDALFGGEIANNTCQNSPAGFTPPASLRVSWTTAANATSTTGTTGTTGSAATTGTTTGTSSASSVVVGSLFILAAVLAF